jgi:aminopeptidase N
MARRTLAVAALTGGLVFSLSASSTPAVSRAAPATPGSDGIGDAYFPLDGNGGINVLAYDVHDRYAFATGQLSGFTRLTVRAAKHLSSFNLDFLLPVDPASGVKVDGVAANATRPVRHELHITPATAIPAGRTFRVRVDYAGRPGPLSYAGESNWLSSANEVVAMNEPHMAPWWFPSNDHPRDKARMDIRVTVPQGREVISNGRRIGRTLNNGLATVHWRAAEPMAPYLAFFAAGSFAVDHGISRGLPWYVAASKQIPAAQRRVAMIMLRRSPTFVRWLQSQLGTYPFSTTGGVVTSLNPGFSLENQTRPTYPGLDRSSTSLMVHELAHQWLGDSVSVDHWRDIWLNEGAATFMEVRYAETHGGRSGHAWLMDNYTSTPRGDPFWNLRIGNPGAARMFDSRVYFRGGMALQALRQRIGNADFWRVMRTWVRGHRSGNGSTPEFRAMAQRVSGANLKGFFDAWFFTPSKPARTRANGLR